MIKEYQISNFKPFADAATIPIRPITLIFGANSSGKSSIFQSILMLKQTLEAAQGPNVVLLPKGKLVDLGSYKEFVHGHDLDRSFSFRMTFPAPKSIDQYADDIDIMYLDNQNQNVEILEKTIGSEMLGLQVTFNLDQTKHNILISKVELFIGTESSPILTYSSAGRDKHGVPQYKLSGINLKHQYWHEYYDVFSGCQEFFAKFAGMKDSEKKLLLEKLMDMASKRTIETQNNKPGPEKEISGFKKAIEDYENMVENESLGLHGFLPKYLNGWDLKDLISEFCDTDDHEWLANTKSVSLFAITAANTIKEFLKRVYYIAPLREYPERYYIYGGNIVENIGVSGKMLPDVLFGNLDILSKVNLEIKRFTGKDYELRVSRLSDERSETSEIFALQLVDMTSGITVNLRDIGFGFSQVLPVIVQTISSQKKTLLIEQPELHLHPALQAELGDLFINAALGEQKNAFIIETHSEHLILRLLRRIRETSKGKLPQGCQPITPDQLAVLHVQPDEDGAKIIRLPVTEDGEFEIPWPEGFFAERSKELF